MAAKAAAFFFNCGEVTLYTFSRLPRHCLFIEKSRHIPEFMDTFAGRVSDARRTFMAFAALVLAGARLTRLFFRHVTFGGCESTILAVLLCCARLLFIRHLSRRLLTKAKAVLSLPFTVVFHTEIRQRNNHFKGNTHCFFPFFNPMTNFQSSQRKGYSSSGNAHMN